MNIPESFPDTPDPFTPRLLLELSSRKVAVLSDIWDLLKSGAIQDETDLTLLRDAAAFIENPTLNLSDIMRHVKHIGGVLGGYAIQGENGPPEVNALNAYLWMLQGINRIEFIEKELSRGAVKSLEIIEAMSNAMRCATILDRGHGDNRFLITVMDLQSRLDAL